MLIKILTRKATQARFKQLIDYVNTATTIPPICINLAYTSNSKEVAHTFTTHMNTYKPKRVKNGVVHTILSFDSRDAVTPEILEDIALTYIDKSGLDNHLNYIAFHTNTSHQHIHVVSSATRYKDSTRTFRLSKKELRTLQLTMEAYQLEHYPQALRHSVVYNRKRDQYKGFIRSTAEKNQTTVDRAMQQRGQSSERMQVIERLAQVAKTVSSAEAFIHAVDQHPLLAWYAYREKRQGIVYKGKKYRLKTLLKTKDLTQIFRFLKYQKTLEKVTKDKNQEITR